MSRITNWTMIVVLGAAVLASQSAFALDVGSIAIRYSTVRVDGAVAGYSVSLVTQGTGISNVQVKNLNNSHVYSLSNVALNTWGFDNQFATLALFQDQQAPSCPYQFNFNETSPGVFTDSIILGYNAAEPRDYVHITFPAQSQVGVSLNPTYAWDNVDKLGEWALGMRVRREADGVDIYDVTPSFALSQTTWQPGTLAASTKYDIFLSIFNIQSGQPMNLQTASGDAFTYSGLFEQANERDFTTVPEPMSLMLIGTGIMGAFGVLRRRRLK